ncbi:ArsC/Spx/MgsR family protein [Roseospirillum parvum]|uniref:Nitrogenase-associated protein n=1 Tax=Roseospirillum parvum TaxID=83401 RepID=A0A1G8E150_9PROT|nr:ArsC/Spx/MgsR family protein [Roseospirillum parvum]SDH63587.1 nitrogenase-associated protein [Roseospirillum parvum]
MAHVIFHERPGCHNNTRQKVMLAEAGHTVEAHDLLAECWSPEILAPFLETLPVARWFNPAATRVKSGEVDPASFSDTPADRARALAALCADPLLIRRPLMEAGGEFRCGFDLREVDAWIGLEKGCDLKGDVQTCPYMDVVEGCQDRFQDSQARCGA